MEQVIKNIILEFYNILPLTILEVGKGFYGKVYKVELPKEPFVLSIKFFEDSKYMFMQAKEQSFIYSFNAIKIPKVIFEYKKEDINAIVMEWIEGENLGEIHLLEEPIKEKIGWEIVKECISLHQITNKTFGYITNKQYSTWQEFYSKLSQEMLDRIEKSKTMGLIDADSFNLMNYAYKKFDKIFSENVVSSSLIHGDLNVNNVIVKNNHVTAIIDPMGVMWGDREIELFQFECSGSEKYNLLEKYFSINKPSKNFELKNAYYKTFAEANHYARINKSKDDNLSDFLAQLEKMLIKNRL